VPEAFRTLNASPNASLDVRRENVRPAAAAMLRVSRRIAACTQGGERLANVLLEAVRMTVWIEVHLLERQRGGNDEFLPMFVQILLQIRSGRLPGKGVLAEKLHLLLHAIPDDDVVAVQPERKALPVALRLLRTIRSAHRVRR
jgi:hypothetical protein